MKEIVIKLSDVMYERLIESKGFSPCAFMSFAEAVKNGKVLPKGHHELIDRCDLMGAYRGSNNIFEALQKTDVIVEADKEEE